MLKSEIEFLKHIYDEVEFIIEFTESINEEQFHNDRLLKKGIVRCFEIIGEATKKVGPDFRLKYNTIPWKEMVGLRDKLIHDYTGVDYTLLWNFCKTSIPELHFQISEILKEYNIK
jgi:uncharacterized protein with HEPN domain